MSIAARLRALADEVAALEAPPPPAPAPEPTPAPPAPQPSTSVPAVLRTIRLSNTGPAMSSVSPVNRGELGTYNRRDSLADFTRREVSWRWQFASGQRPAVLPRCRLMLDGEPITEWQAPASTAGAYVFDVALPLGHHVAYVEAEDVAICCYAVACVVNDTGAPLPVQQPWSVVNRFEHRQRGVSNVAVQFQYATGGAVAPRPMKPRTIVQSSELVSKAQWWTQHGTASNSSLTRRWALTPDGDVVVEHDQKYFHSHAITAPGDTEPPLPSTTVRDGPRGVGTLGYVADMIVRPGGKGVYFVETNGRIGLLKRDGTVITEGGLHLKPGALKLHAGVVDSTYMHRSNAARLAKYSEPWEQYGDWSQVTGPHSLMEPWGLAVAERLPGDGITTTDGHEFWVCDTRHDRILFADHWTAHSQAGFQPAHFPPPWYVQAPGPTGTTTWCDFLGPQDAVREPWKCRVSPVDRKLYWTNFAGNSIARCNLDGSGVEVILRCALQPSNAQLGVASRLARGAHPETLRHLVIDGADGVASCVRPTGMDIDSEGNVVFVEHYTYAIRRLNVSTRVVTTLGYIINRNSGSDSSGNREPNLVVDSGGTCGPVDDIFTAAWGGNTDRRYDKHGTPRGSLGGFSWRQWAFVSGAQLRNGPLSRLNGPGYFWGIGVGHGFMVASGNGSGSQYFEGSRMLPDDPAPDLAAVRRGMVAWDAAGVLEVIYGPEGQGELGFADYGHLAAMPDAELAALLTGHGVPAASVADVMTFVRWSAVDLA